MSDREPCPVCGHPTGDCVGEETRPVKIIGANIFPSLGHSDVYVVKEDVYYDQLLVETSDDIIPELSRQRIRFKKGQIISLTEAQFYNLPFAK